MRTPTARVASVDMIRGAVMILMAIDHVRVYAGVPAGGPDPGVFFTRWITHFCAPAFFLLAGVGAGIAHGRGQSTSGLARFLLGRGVWLIVAELTFTAIGWRFDFDLMPLFGIVLWALGWSMIAMAALIWLPSGVLTTLALATLALHNLADGVRPDDLGALAPLWHFLHVPGFAIPGTLLIAYPLIPWVAVMALGFVLADVYRWDDGRRRRFLVGAGVAATLLFIALRGANGYGNAQPWTIQRSPALTVASFLNVTKYPPSLHFLLMTLGPTLVALALLERVRGRASEWLALYGSVPFFFYVVHIFVAHAVGVAIAFLQGGVLRRIPAVIDPGSLPAWYGLPLPGVYVAWMLVVVLMYPICRWFARLKRQRDDWWLRYW